MASIDANNVRQVTGFRRRTWYRLSGLFSKELPKNFVSYRNCRVWGTEDLLEVSIVNENVIYSMRCNIPEKFIYVLLCEFKHTKKGHATALLKYKLNISRSMNFERIDCKASAEIRNRKKDTGYIVWGKLGFTMAEEEQKSFEHENHKIGNTTFQFLHDLLKFKGGVAYWEGAGYTWQANFFLQKNSLNKKLFKEYLKNRTEII